MQRFYALLLLSLSLSAASYRVLCAPSSARLADDVDVAILPEKRSNAAKFDITYRGQFPSQSDGEASSYGVEQRSNINGDGGGGEASYDDGSYNEAGTVSASRPKQRTAAAYEPAFVAPGGGGAAAAGTTAIEISTVPRGRSVLPYRGASQPPEDSGNYNAPESESQQPQAADSYNSNVAEGDVMAEFDKYAVGENDNKNNADMQTVEAYVPGKGYTKIKVGREKPDQYNTNINKENEEIDIKIPEQQQQDDYKPAPKKDYIELQIDTGKKSADYSEPAMSQYNNNKPDDEPSQPYKPVDPNAEVYVPGKGYSKGLGFQNEYGPWSPGFGMQPAPEKDTNDYSVAEQQKPAPPVPAFYKPAAENYDSGSYNGGDEGQRPVAAFDDYKRPSSAGGGGGLGLYNKFSYNKQAPPASLMYSLDKYPNNQ